MKKTLITLAIASVITFGAAELFAWGWGWGRHHGNNGYHHGSGYHHGYGGRGFGNVEYLKDALGLTDKQTESIIKINSEFRTKYYRSRNNVDKIDALRIEHRKVVEKILTKTQRVKLKDLNRYRGRRDYRGNRGCPNW